VERRGRRHRDLARRFARWIVEASRRGVDLVEKSLQRLGGHGQLRGACEGPGSGGAASQQREPDPEPIGCIEEQFGGVVAEIHSEEVMVIRHRGAARQEQLDQPHLGGRSHIIFAHVGPVAIRHGL
jgi:hypothetical protein